MDVHLIKKLEATKLPEDIQHCIKIIYANDKQFLQEFLPKNRSKHKKQWEEFVLSLHV
jgi:hypothetical protein